jgi:hypothetical protein
MTTITLRARVLEHPLAVGDLIARATPGPIYRVVSATAVRVAGDPKKNHTRLVLERLPAAHKPAGGEIRPWPRAPQPPRQRRPREARASADPGPTEPASARLSRIRAKAPLMLDMAIDAIRRNRVAEQLAQATRAARVGRDDGLREGRDYGPGIRLRPALARRRGLLREADVEVVAGPDPARPNATVSRARRCDPLVKLHKAGSIAGRHVDAAEKLREQLEAAECGGGGGSLSEIHVPAHQRQGVSDWQLLNSTRVREAVNAVASTNRPMLMWAVNGGNVSGFATFARMRHTTAAEYLRAGLAELADHYRLPGG